MKQQMFMHCQTLKKTEELGILLEKNILFEDYYSLLRDQCEQEMIHTIHTSTLESPAT